MQSLPALMRLLLPLMGRAAALSSPRKPAASRRAGLLFGLASPLLIVGCSGSTPPIDRSAATDIPSGTVTVVIPVGDQTVRHEIESVPEGTTVAQVMAEISDPPVTLNGSGAMTFVESIGELDTSGGQGWSYRVDGEWADRGVGAYRLSPPASIEWSHGSYESTSD